MKKKLAVLLVAALTLGMTACGASKGAGDTAKREKSTVYAVEAGSAGEEAAKEIMDTNPRYKDIQDICVLIGAAIKGVSPEEAYSMIGQSKKKK